MQFDKRYVDEIKKEFSQKPNGMKLKFWLEQHLDIKKYLYSLIDQYESFTCISNILYCLFANIDVDMLKCKHCNRPIKMTTNNVIHEYCSRKCAANDEEKKQHIKETIEADENYYKKRQEKIINTNIERYGTKAPAMNKLIIQKMKDTWAENPDIWKNRNEKLKATIQEKYGVDNVSKLEDVKQQKKQTVFKNYGVEHQMLSNVVKDKIKQTCLTRYGVDNTFKTEKCKQKLLDKSWATIIKWKDYVIPNFTRDEFIGYSQKELEWKCVKCGQIFKQKVYSTKFTTISDLVPRCLKCYPSRDTSSVEEQNLFDYCYELDKSTESHNRNLINPYELDIVIPDKKLAIEFDGMYWHSDALERIDKCYHLNKTEMCEYQGYQLLHVFEYDWKHHNQIIKSKIKSMLNIDQQNIYGRKCIVNEIDNTLKNNFLNNNHIQGEDNSSVKLGLYYNNLLVAVMTFGKPRFNKKYQYELIRYATLDGYRIIGGAGKLLSYFERQYNPTSIITYADRRYSKGNMYFKLGFTFLYNSDPSYYYTKDQYCLTRYQCQKSKLSSILGEDKFNPNLSENDNMKLNGWNKIYDCGNMVFEKK